MSQTSMILTTHYMDEAEKLCDYIVILDNGLILCEGTIDQLLSESKSLDDLFTSLTGRRIYE
jgi:ABC-type multidrug transport system ATPase subunit